MWTIKRERTDFTTIEAGVIHYKRETMSGVDIFEVIILTIVFFVGVIGFVKVALKDD